MEIEDFIVNKAVFVYVHLRKNQIFSTKIKNFSTKSYRKNRKAPFSKPATQDEIRSNLEKINVISTITSATLQIRN